MDTQKEILNHLIDIKHNVGGIEQHLDVLNSKVATNVFNIEQNRIKTDQINITIAKWAGAFSALLFVVNVILFCFFK